MKIKTSKGGFQRALLVASSLSVGSAAAFQIDAGPDWNVNWDNTIQYNLGFRAQKMDHNIGNNPAYSENNYQFEDRGDIVTNRLSLLSELDAEYMGGFGSAGFRVSGSLFRDFAYDGDVRNHPGEVAPGVPYQALGSYRDDRFSSETKRYHMRGAQLLDAFVFANFDAFERPTSVQFGRLTSYWGNSLFFGGAGIGYSQNAVDNVKGASAPGTQAKELAMPRGQLLLSHQLAPDLTVQGQYFLEFEGNRIPQGGTYLGVTGFLFEGPDYMFGPGGIHQGKEYKPDHINDNFGLRASWNPYWLRGTLSAYYRHFDETQPWAPLLSNEGGVSRYHMAYAQGVDLFGLSLEKQIGDYSTGYELSYRRGTALNSVTGPLGHDPRGKEGARGDTLHAVANVIYGLTASPLYDAGVVTAEMAYTRKLKVTDNKELYNGRGTTNCRSKWDGCSTDDALGIALHVMPQWFQVFPGVDLDMPIFAQYGLYGNSASLSGTNQGALVYTIGLHALIERTYNVTLQYNGYHAHASSRRATFDPTVPAGTPGYESFYAGGNGAVFYNDKDWISLTFQFSF